MRVELQPAYVLHSRPYRDTSLIVDFLTPDYGRLSVVSRGGRARKGKGGVRQLLNPFQKLLVSCQGKGELKTLTLLESNGVPSFFSGRILFSALYLNELLMRLLLPMDAHPIIFDRYQVVMDSLDEASGDDSLLESLLRGFEFSLLQELGYGLCFNIDAKSGVAIEKDSYYCFEPGVGFYHDKYDTPAQFQIQESLKIKGDHLLAIMQSEFSSAEVRRAAKLLSRSALAPLLGSKPLKSRELFLV